jgi:peptide/nickel transport system substrate-binding protein
MQWLPLYFEGDGAKPIINQRLSLAYPPTWSDGDRTVTINLKHYMWSDGKPVTSRDVELWYNLQLYNKAKNDFYTPGQLPDDVKSVSYPSSTQIVMHLTRPYSEQWFDDNQLTWIFALPHQSWDRTSLNGPVGNYDRTKSGAQKVFNFLTDESKQLSTYPTNPLWQVVDGPWHLTGYDATTYKATFVPNTKYSGPDKPKLSKYVIESFASNQAEINALRSGEVTYGYLNPDNYSQKSYFTSHGYTVAAWQPQFVQWDELGFTSKTYGPLVRQLYIRQALQHLVNQPLYNSAIFHGLGQPTYGPVPNTPGSPFPTPQDQTNHLPYSVSAARALLTSHGWAPGPGGYMVCKQPGTGANQCGAGIAAGRQLKLLFMYSTDYPYLLAQVESYVTSAKQAGINLPLDPQSANTMYSIAGVCPPGPCNYGIVGYSNWFWDYGQGAVLPSGDSDFATGNYWGGGYSSPKMDQLINQERYHSGLSHLYAWENYIVAQSPVIFFPTVGTWSVVSNNLKGWQPQNAFGYYVPSLWSSK